MQQRDFPPVSPRFRAWFTLISPPGHKKVSFSGKLQFFLDGFVPPAEYCACKLHHRTGQKAEDYHERAT